MASIYRTNLHTGEKTLCIDGLTQAQAENYVDSVRPIWPMPEQVGEGVWQGFTFSIEPDEEGVRDHDEILSGIRTMRKYKWYLLQFRGKDRPVEIAEFDTYADALNAFDEYPRNGRDLGLLYGPSDEEDTDEDSQSG